MDQKHIESIGNEFVKIYYTALQSGNREQLFGLYNEHSCMSYEGTQLKGQPDIIAKLNSLSFKTIVFDITTIDSQPIIGIDDNTSVLISVMGRTKTDDDPIHSFYQIFLLRKSSCGNYCIANESYRLVVHNS